MGYVIASRKSDLARLQAYRVGETLIEKFPDQEIKYYFRESLGDKNLNDPLWKMPEKGVFTEDFREGLLKGEFDMVVHSWKDLPVDLGEGTAIVATLNRADQRDLFLLKKSCWSRVQERGELRVFSSSPRRIYNLTDFFKDHLPGNISKVEFQSVRGNIPTRINKMFADDSIDGLILAKAAWDRLLLSRREEFSEVRQVLQKAHQECRWMVLPLRINPNAAAQGALAIEIAEDRDDLRQLLAQINCPETFASVQKEREILKSYGGGCHQKIGVSVLSRPYGQVTFVRGETDQGEILRRNEMTKVTEQKFDREESFPTTATEGQWFSREELSFEEPRGCHHFVARANAFALRPRLQEDAVVWVSGLQTWKKLAQRGVWVHGSCEGLGEHEDFRIQALATDKPWVKWTHSAGVVSDRFQNLATYELRPKPEIPDLANKMNFFWRSGSAFIAAVEAQPEILQCHHFCGPGNTHQQILKYLEEKNLKTNVQIALDFDYWSNTTWRG